MKPKYRKLKLVAYKRRFSQIKTCSDFTSIADKERGDCTFFRNITELGEDFMQ